MPWQFLHPQSHCSAFSGIHPTLACVSCLILQSPPFVFLNPMIHFSLPTAACSCILAALLAILLPILIAFIVLTNSLLGRYFLSSTCSTSQTSCDSNSRFINSKFDKTSSLAIKPNIVFDIDFVLHMVKAHTFQANQVWTSLLCFIFKHFH